MDRYAIYYIVQPMPGDMVGKQIILDGTVVLVLGVIFAYLYRGPERT